MHDSEPFFRVAVALAAGLLIGLERGWHERESGSGQRVAGIRSFALFGLLGAGWGVLLGEADAVLLGLAFVGFAIVLAASQVVRAMHVGDYGITTSIAGLLTFVLGAAAVRGHTTFVASAAVLTATLLGVKPILHRWVRTLERRDLYAAFKMLLISVVLLPVLPDRRYGPFDAFNPYEIWWMVVLIAGVSFSGYVAMKIAGDRLGVVLTGLFGGLVSSTAVALSFSRMARDRPDDSRMLSAGIWIAAATMFPRSVLLAGALHPPLALPLAAPLGAMAVVCFAAAGYWWRRRGARPDERGEGLRNPLELATALKFGAFLALVMFLVRALREEWGDAGVYAAALLSGVADVDTVTLSMSRLAALDLDVTVAVRAIVVACVANTIFKAALVAVIAGRSLALRIAAPMALSASAGIAIALV